MSATVSDLFDIAEAFLLASHDALTVTDEGPPLREFVSPGEPALDCCGQLVVWTEALTETDFNAGQGARAPTKRINRGGQFEQTVRVQITRCGPTIQRSGEPPPEEKLTAAGRMVNEDLWALWVGLSWQLKHGALAQICSGALRLPAVPLVPQGMCIGWTLGYRYPVEGGTFAT